MKFIFTRAQGKAATASVAGDVLTLNGVPYDFSFVEEGGEMPSAAIGEPLINGPVTRVDGAIVVPLIAPHAPGQLPESLWHPEPEEVVSGDVPLPAYQFEELA
ncbi:hypothetical protein PVT71_14515 [Salipiger sp. H15]|uniref:Uncharacterized protein n=1 Tax=Alloyangia sp. H15 TaxID=3029062 RepID=A0AAU8AM56_9RHOB